VPAVCGMHVSIPTWPRFGGAFFGVPSMIDSLEVDVLYPA